MWMETGTDLVLADWGPGNPLNNGGAKTRLWLNDGNGNFVDVDRHPDTRRSGRILLGNGAP